MSSGPVEKVEGQFIAQAILGGEPTAWQRFFDAYGERLAQVARRRTDDARMRSRYAAEDLVQGFVTEKILQHPARMLGPVANGANELWPRLSRSFANFCTDIFRRLEPISTMSAPLEQFPAKAAGQRREEQESITAQRIFRQLNERAGAIRDTFAIEGRAVVPQREVLLLSERLVLAEQIAVSYVAPEGHLPPSINVPQFAEDLWPWIAGEQSRPMPQSGQGLGEVWQGLGEAVCQPPFHVDSQFIAERLEIRRNTWDIWVRRARVKVIKHIGSDSAMELFPHWPAKLTESLTVEGSTASEETA